MANCTGCGAPLPGSSTLCNYCGTRNNFDLSAVGEYTVTTPHSERFCPCCANTELETINVGHSSENPFYIERCPSCGGLFFDIGELELLLDTTVQSGGNINHDRLRQIVGEASQETFEVVYRKCPVCQQMMQRKSYGAQSRVIIDRCVSHGIWLDPGELRRLMEWKSAGGELLHKKMKATQTQYEQERAKEHKASMLRGTDGYHTTYQGSSHESSLSSFVDLLTTLF